MLPSRSGCFPKRPGHVGAYGRLAQVLDKLDVPIHVQHVRAAWDMVEAGGVNIEQVVHHKDGPLRLAGSGRELDRGPGWTKEAARRET